MKVQFVGLLALAIPVAAASAPPSSIVVNCQQRNWPSLERVAQETGLNAFDPVARVRKRAIVAGVRACRTGASEIQLVFEPQVQLQGIEVAQAAGRR